MFGISKGRFMILQNGLRETSLAKYDQAWMTCCALHNMLLFVDGFHEGWKKGNASCLESNVKNETNIFSL